MKKYQIIVETVDGEYQGLCDSMADIGYAVDEVNTSDESKLIFIGNIIVRAGSIKSICIDKEVDA